MHIRPEKPGDEDIIHDLTDRAFEPMPYGDGTEAEVIRILRRDGDLVVSLVAIEDDKIIGQISFSPASIDGQHNNWFGLGPISVEPDWQKKGIGRALVEAGLEQIRGLGAKGCALIGDPKLYHRLGFKSDGALTYLKHNRKIVHWMSFDGGDPVGELKFAPAFDIEQQVK